MCLGGKSVSVNPHLTEPILTQLAKGVITTHHIFNMNRRMMFPLVPVVSLESLLNIDTK